MVQGPVRHGRTPLDRPVRVPVPDFRPALEGRSLREIATEVELSGGGVRRRLRELEGR
ncbi:MAG: hypothetical protein AVDCRST_MAG49-4141 [uncultured Thermomicrobiales bacterium]|uniref:Uncharacterized protein n=1 Tax=uncultured Thermomicrobiales bacterium TaxID=1645740 RepID=A0A6J4VD97_9BACT|nr:MAG: hypothetical protein AVDCRST_MAG49-4141 [uncultured Thermomicrobiales bacterium]